ncbi:hypothetical protein SAMD00019534_040730 [Acytostelium subglobosum LB1]|uniref:hypothetical protein n=1 Tax=Acytostelium subglobosum LB1 TaxID=1410327 RepID=UPI0006451E07|nr:hypothetical protein SAMD00019534_040730 [Acytostelium subglobosum LB1]GAM20898.1 hypothetical protein SAMD00019534_040730 [Acytostelium subglobosum LB1]|eukprot:XP_012756032.1 hypothetical protein SAMD00019534_040730 [Acytostelium subglobosum LB1]
MQKTKQSNQFRFHEYQFTSTKEEAYLRADRSILSFQGRNLSLKKKDGTFTTPEDLVVIASHNISTSDRNSMLQHTMSTMAIGGGGGGGGGNTHINSTSSNMSSSMSSSMSSMGGSTQHISSSSSNRDSGANYSIKDIVQLHSNLIMGSGSAGGSRASGTLASITKADGGMSNSNSNSSSGAPSAQLHSNQQQQSIEFEYHLSFTQLVTLPPSLYSLIWLQKLVLTHHNIRTLSEDIGKLQMLQVLILDNNRLVGLPSAIGSLVNLKRLEADNNHLVSLCPLERLTKLEVLSLNNNKLTQLPTAISSLLSLKTLNIKQNPIITPPTSVISKGLKDIVLFLRELETGERPCLRSKLIVVGNTGAGKSSVIQSIRGKKKKSSSGSSMEGIEIDQHEFDAVLDEEDRKRKTFTVSTWDIARKEVYFATNQLFVSERSVYVLVFDLSGGDTLAVIEYWLHSITSVAPNSPIVLVGTHIDYFEDINKVNGILESISRSFQKQFTKIQAIISVSCTTGYDVDRLRQLIEDIVKSQPILRTKIPSSFFTFEEALLEAKKKRIPPIMNWQEYINLANICNLKDSVKIQRATEFLHNIGSIMYFNDPNSTVGKMVILDHQWIINCLTSLITARSIALKNGIIRQSHLAGIWKAPNYPEHLHSSLLDIMHAFEISFPLPASHHLLSKEELGITSSAKDTSHSEEDPKTPGESRHLVPALLPENGNTVSQWEDFDDPDIMRLNRQYHLPFIPERFFGKLIIRLLQFVRVEACLKHVVIVSNNQGHEALIELKESKANGKVKKILTVNVRGVPKPVGLLRIVTDTIESLFSQWYRLDIKRYVSCFECSFLYDQRATLFTIEECEEAMMDGKSILNCHRKQDEHDEGTTHRLPLEMLVPDIAMVDIPRPRFDLKDIKIIKEVGKGAFGIVYEAEWNGEIVALKKLIPPIGADNMQEDEKKEDRLRVFREFSHEVYSMSRLSHPNVMKISGYCLQPLCMALEYVKHGSLYNLLSNNLIEIGWGLRLQIATEIAKGMHHMHSHNPPMIHRDLKSPNILMHGFVEGNNPVSTIIDYGTSTELYGGAALARCVDQPLWLAPEVMASMPYSEPSDVYAFGIMLWELYTRAHPYDEFAFGQWMSKLEDEIILGLRPTIPASCPPEYVELIQSCWAHEPNSRPTFASIVETLGNLKKRFAPVSSTLPPHIRNQVRKTRSQSFSDWSSTSAVNLRSEPITSGVGSNLTQSRDLSSSVSSNLQNNVSHASFHHTASSSSISSGEQSDELPITHDDMLTLGIFTEEELEQPYPFVEDDQRGILLGYDDAEHMSTPVSIVTAATLNKMIELMTRNDSGMLVSTTSPTKADFKDSGVGRKRSDTAGKALQPMHWPLKPTSSSVHVTQLDESFIDDFIYLYRSFTTPVEVFKILVKRYFGPRADKADPLTMRRFEQRRVAIRNGVAIFIKRWSVDITTIEFQSEDNWLLTKMDDFVQMCYANEPGFVASVSTTLDAHDPEKLEQQKAQLLLIQQEDNMRVIMNGQRMSRSLTSSSTSDYSEASNASVGSQMSQLSQLSQMRRASVSIAATVPGQSVKSFLNLAIAIRDPLYGVPLREKKYKGKIVTRCFTGADVVDWIVKTALTSREEAGKLGIDFLAKNFINALNDDGVVTLTKVGNESKFIDSQVIFYVFHDDDAEFVANQYTALELNMMQKIHPRDLLGFSVGLATSDDVDPEKFRQLNFPNICTYFQWFQKMTMLVATEIVKQRDIRSRAEMIERNIKIALEYLSQWNFNGIMQILSALHSEPISRLSASWNRLPVKYFECFIELSRMMLPEANYHPLRVVLSGLPVSVIQNYPTLAPYMTRQTCPTIPFLGALIADLSQTSTENPTFVSSGGEKMANILRMKRLSKLMKAFKDFKDLPSFYRPPLSTTPLPWYQQYASELKTFDYHQINRLSEIERRLEVEAEINGTAGDDLQKEGDQALGNSDSLGYGHEELTERDWSVLLTNATVITYHHGDVVIEENTINSYLYRIKTGTLSVEKKMNGKSVKVATMEAPKMFGEMSFLGNKTTARIVVVDGKADLYVMDIPFLNHLFVSHPRLGAKFYKIMANQLAARLKNLPTSKPVATTPTSSPVMSPIKSPSPLLNSSSSSTPSSSPSIPPINLTGLQSTSPTSPRTSSNFFTRLDKRSSTFLTPRGSSEKEGSNRDSLKVNRTQTMAQLNEPGTKKNDQEFWSRFSLHDEIVIKDYPCSMARSGRCYISQGHVCFYSKFFGYKTKKKIPFKEMQDVFTANNTGLEITRIKNGTRAYRLIFQNQKDQQDALHLILSLFQSSKESTSADQIKEKLQQERKKENNLTMKSKNHNKADQLTKEDWEVIGREGSKLLVYTKDQPIVKQGDRIQKIFQITKGVCRIEKMVPNPREPGQMQSVILGTMKQDDTFGEITYLLSGEVTANVIADSSEVEVYAIEGQFVNILFDLSPSLATKWFKYLAVALNKTLIDRESQLYSSTTS